jgi:hypothetical protein
MIKNREVSIERYFKWWISIKLMWVRYLPGSKEGYVIKING